MIDLDDMAAWLCDQLDDEERVARKAWTGDGWRAGWYTVETPAAQPTEVWTGRSAPGHTPIPISSSWNASIAEHIALHDPTRVLAKVTADQQIVAYCAQFLRPNSAAPQDLAPDAWRVLQLMALPYSDRPGYRESWRP